MSSDESILPNKHDLDLRIPRSPAEFIRASEYIPEQLTFCSDRGEPIDVETLNKEASQWVVKCSQAGSKVTPVMIPGFSGPQESFKNLHWLAKKRLDRAVKFSTHSPEIFFIVSGGNVYPKGTRYNEAIEMKRYLMESHRIDACRIVVDVYAQNSVENVRNTGRFLLSHGIESTDIVTTGCHSLYLSYPKLSGFRLRSRFLFSGALGALSRRGRGVTLYRPSQQVFLL